MAMTAKVRKKKTQDLTAEQAPIGQSLSAAEPMFTKPTLAQQVQMREMMTAKAMAQQPTMSATQPDLGIGEVAMAGKVKVKPKGLAPQGADIYDERIGGYGKSMGPQESGEAAVQRIMKSKVKRKKVM